MTIYCTPADVRFALTSNLAAEAEYPQTAASLDDATLLSNIEEAGSFVDMHILARYMVPTEVVDQDGPQTVAKAPVRWWTRNIAAYFATLTFRQSRDLNEDDPVRLRFRATVEMLEAVRSGALDIPEFEPSEDSGEGGVEVVNTYDGKMFWPEDFGLTKADHLPQVYVPRRHW